MAENSAISWTRHTWNPWMGCTKVSPACDGCYAEALMDKRYGKVQWGNAPRVRTGIHTWNDPLRWNRQAVKDGDRPFVFCASLADIFDNQVDPQWRADAFEVMRKTPRLVYLLLTKRPQNIVNLSDEAGGLPPNAAIGTTVEDQRRVEINVPHLLAAKAILRPLFAFVSCEPLLGQINLHWIAMRGTNGLDALSGVIDMDDDTVKKSACIDWVISGGETDQGGHKARPTKPDWFRSLRDQCAAAGDGIGNLRQTNQPENTKNAKRQVRNKSGCTGVDWYAASEKWRASIRADGQRVHLGHFDKIEDAIAARKQAERLYGFHPNHGRAA